MADEIDQRVLTIRRRSVAGESVDVAKFCDEGWIGKDVNRRGVLLLRLRVFTARGVEPAERGEGAKIFRRLLKHRNTSSERSHSRP